MADIILDIGGDTSRLDRDIRQTVNKAYSINLKTKGEQPLGRITGKVNEFEKSLAASNARVIAFGASAGIIFGLQNAFRSLAESVISVQKSLQDINVILNVSQDQLNKFGSSLFAIARNTGQSFDEVAKAATEFSRQGLGVEETLKRTNEALILSRLSGLDAAKSVEALTAAVNSFASQSVTATEIVNKFATVDAAFAVSSADLADAISRVGSSAAQSGVSLNELIAIVTSAQQTTARGGAVIGNSFKTIFTRLQREKVVDLLESLGISSTDATGQVKSTIQLLTELGKVYDTLGAQQQAYVAEQVGGVFQINILKAALADLGKEYSIYNSALQVAATATDQAVRRNEELNKTYAAQLNALQQNAKQVGGTIGERLLSPLFDRTVGNLNELLGGINEADANSFGATLGKGILDGLGQVIAGPGLILFGGVILKLLKDFSGYATSSAKDLLGLNNASKQQKEIQQSINQIISKNPELYSLMQQGANGLNQASEKLLANLRAQTVELQKQNALSAQVAKTLYSSGVRINQGVPIVQTPKTTKTKSGGFIPNFSVQKEISGIKKSRDYTSNQKRKASENVVYNPNFPGLGPTIYNGQESVVESTKVAEALGYPPGTKPKNPAEKLSILTPAMANNLGFAAKGFIPNFANAVTVGRIASVNHRVAQNLGRNLEEDDVISSGSIQSIFFDPKVSKGAAYEKEALAWLNKNKGGGWLDNKSLRFKGNAAVDAFRVKNNKIELAEFKAGRYLNQLILNKFLRAIPENYGSFGDPFGKAFSEGILTRKDSVNVSGYLLQARKKNQKEITSKFSEKNVLKAKAAEEQERLRYLSRKGFIKYKSYGFIPNFAPSSNVIDVGDITNRPPILKNKVISLIYPEISEGYTKVPVSSVFNKQTFKGSMPVAGINPKVPKEQLPDLKNNVTSFLTNEANEFGRILGGQTFIKESELPNRGAVEGAAGNAFEGAVMTLFKNNVTGRAQNAGIDFKNPSATVRRIFNNAPGQYDAKINSTLANEVFSKLLAQAKPGVITQRSGAAGKEYQRQREAAIAQLNKEGITGAAVRKKALRERFGIFAEGFIPNFAAMQKSINREVQSLTSKGISKKDAKDSIGIGFDNNLITSDNESGAGVFSSLYGQNSIKDAFKDHRGENLKKVGSKSSGFIPNFAETLGTQDIQAESASNTVGAIIAQVSMLGFALNGVTNDYKSSINEIIETAEKENATKLASITTQQEQLDQTKKNILEERRSGKISKETAKLKYDEARIRSASLKAQAGGLTARATGFQKVSAGMKAGAFPAMIAAPIIAETIANSIGKATKEDRVNSSIASGLGTVASFTATGAMFGPWGAAIGAATGTVIALNDVLKQASTDLPELGRAADEATQKLSRIGESTQQAMQLFTQFQEQKGAGNNEEAAKLLIQLQTLLKSQFKDNPELVAKALAAIQMNNAADFTDALGEASKKSTEDVAATNRKVILANAKEAYSRINNLSDVGSRTVISGKSEREDIEKSYKALLPTSNLYTMDLKGLESLSDQIGNVLTKAPEAAGGTRDPAQLRGLLESLGYTPEEVTDVTKQIANDGLAVATAYLALAQEVQNQVDIAKTTAQISASNNKEVQKLNKIIQEVGQNYSLISALAKRSAKLDTALNRESKIGQFNFRQASLEGDIRLAEVLGATQQGRELNVQKQVEATQFDARKPLEESFDQLDNVLKELSNVDLDEAFTRAASGSSVSTMKKNVGESDDAFLQRKMAAQIEGYTREEKIKNPNYDPKNPFSPEMITKYIAERGMSEVLTAQQNPDYSALKDILEMEGVRQEDGNLNVKAFESALKARFPNANASAQQTELLNKATEILMDINDNTALSEKQIKEQTKVILRQDLNKLIEKLAQATINAFGGFEAGFLNTDRGKKTIGGEFTDVAVSRSNLINAINRDAAQGKPITDIATQDLGRFSGQMLSILEKAVGGPLGLEVGGPNSLRGQEIAGRASQIEQILRQIQTAPGATEPGQQQALKAMEEKFFQRAAMTDRYQQVQQQYANDPAGMAEAMRKLTTEAAKEIATIQSNALRETGDLGSNFYQEALTASGFTEDQKKLLAEGGGEVATGDKAIIQQNAQMIKQGNEQIGLLQNLIDSLKAAVPQPTTGTTTQETTANQNNNVNVSTPVTISINTSGPVQGTKEQITAIVEPRIQQAAQDIAAQINATFGPTKDAVNNMLNDPKNAGYKPPPQNRSAQIKSAQQQTAGATQKVSDAALAATPAFAW